MMWRLLGPAAPWTAARCQFDELGNVARFSVDEKFRGEAYKEITSGVWFDTSDDGSIATASAANNGAYGIWLRGSSRNVITDCNGTAGNGDIGILLGCGSSKCTGNSERSDQNRITNSGASGNTNAGIVIEKKSGSNLVTVTHNGGNPQDHDMVDENNQCGTNIWYNNTGSGNQSCVQ